MKYSIQHIGPLLKRARLEKRLSQRAVSLRVGLPQGHLSKIESGLVDMQISSFIELARVLDLEIMLIHRSLVHVVEALQRGIGEEESEQRSKYSLEDSGEE
jgi:transcriptional regulator with XRE-family HTH domain